MDRVKVRDSKVQMSRCTRVSPGVCRYICMYVFKCCIQLLKNVRKGNMFVFVSTQGCVDILVASVR